MLLEWIKQSNSYNVYDTETILSIKTDLLNNIYVLHRNDFSDDSYHLSLTSLDKDGMYRWSIEKIVSTNESDTLISDIAIDDVGNIYIVYSGYLEGILCIHMIKASIAGSVIWELSEDVVVSISTNMHSYNPRISVDGQGYIYCAYNSAGNSENITDNTGENQTIVLFKLDTDGNLMWITRNDFNTVGTNEIPALVVSENGNCYCAYKTDGYIDEVPEEERYLVTRIVVFKTNSLGVLSWIHESLDFNTNLNCINPEIVIDPEENIYIAYSGAGQLGTDDSETYENEYATIVFSLDAAGECRWAKQSKKFNQRVNIQNPKIAIDLNKNIYVTGGSNTLISGNENSIEGEYDIFMFKLYGDDGSFAWIRQYNEINTSGSDDNLVITCDSYSNVIGSFRTTGALPEETNTGQDIIIFKYNNNLIIPSVLETRVGTLAVVQDTIEKTINIKFEYGPYHDPANITYYFSELVGADNIEETHINITKEDCIISVKLAGLLSDAQQYEYCKFIRLFGNNHVIVYCLNDTIYYRIYENNKWSIQYSFIDKSIIISKIYDVSRNYIIYYDSENNTAMCFNTTLHLFYDIPFHSTTGDNVSFCTDGHTGLIAYYKETIMSGRTKKTLWYYFSDDLETFASSEIIISGLINFGKKPKVFIINEVYYIACLSIGITANTFDKLIILKRNVSGETITWVITSLQRQKVNDFDVCVDSANYYVCYGTPTGLYLFSSEIVSSKTITKTTILETTGSVSNISIGTIFSNILPISYIVTINSINYMKYIEVNLTTKNSMIFSIDSGINLQKLNIIHTDTTYIMYAKTITKMAKFVVDEDQRRNSTFSIDDVAKYISAKYKINMLMSV